MTAEAQTDQRIAAQYRWLLKYIAFPMAFWGMGALAWYFILPESNATWFRSVVLFVVLVFAFFWIGLFSYRQGVWGRVYLALVFGVPVVSSGVAAGVHLANLWLPPN